MLRLMWAIKIKSRSVIMSGTGILSTDKRSHDVRSRRLSKACDLELTTSSGKRESRCLPALPTEKAQNNATEEGAWAPHPDGGLQASHPEEPDSAHH